MDHAVLQVARPRVSEPRLLLDAGGLGTKPVQLQDRRRDTAADVEDAANRRRSGGEQRSDDVADVDEVARLVPIAEDLGLPPIAQPIEEDRDDTALERRKLARS